MPIITISRGSFIRGKEVAEKVAARLGYECISREVIIEASREFDVDEVKLTHAISDAPSLFERVSYGKERYIAYIRATLLARLTRDNVVYHGLAGHFFVRDIAHALKVNVIADMEDRLQQVMKRDGVSEKAARRFINHIDKERKKWSQKMYGIDARDPKLYDMVLHVNKIRVDDVVDIICHTAGIERLQANGESRRAIEDEALAAAVKALLIKKHPEAEVTSQDGTVFVNAKAFEAEELRMAEEIESIAGGVPGVKEVHINLHWYTPFGT